MEISNEQFFKIASKIGLSEQNKKAFWEALEADGSKDSSMSKLLYYLGAMIVISMQTWFMSLGWSMFGGGGIFLISILYAIMFVVAGAKLWKKERLKIPAGLLITMAVSLTPLAIYGLEIFLGIKSSCIWMEIGTIVAGLVALRFYSFPFLTAPIFFAAWLILSKDMVPLLIVSERSFEQEAFVSLIFGMLFLLIAYVIDLKKMSQYSFWGYLFGTVTFWGSLTVLCFGKGEIALFLYLLINLSMMVMSILLKRKVLLIFGAIGAFYYFCHLAYNLFENSILFPFVLTFIGLIVIYFGVLYQKNSERIENKILNFFPK